ncbi:MAG: glycosyltransferase family 1 protein [Lachnospiraceae bacterium]|nr:glycosyltransferase family 1 protein [Lachnospiraceae bacterium]
MKRVLQIATTPLQWDGLSKVLISLFEHAPEGKIKGACILGLGALPEFEERLKAKGVKPVRVPQRNRHVFGYMLVLWKVLKTGHFDVVHIHGNSATMAIEAFIARLCRVPVRISHCHNTRTNHPFVHKLLKKRLKRDITLAAACGNEAGEFLYDGDFTVIPNCINVADFGFDENVRERMRNELGVHDEIVIGHVGRFSYQKNHEFLVDIYESIVKKNENVKLLLIGSGELEDDIRKKVEERNLSNAVVFVGNVDNVNEYMQAMDVFVLPSRYEGLSITAIEAQAAGLPCVFSDAMTGETKMTESVWFVPLDEGADKWADRALACVNHENDMRRRGAEDIRLAGYDEAGLESIITKVWNLS